MLKLWKPMSIFIFVGLISLYVQSCQHMASTNVVENKIYQFNIDSTRVRAKSALEFCRTKGLNTEFCILIDMKIHSGLKRFFVWNFKKDTITNQFIVGHGCCDNPWNQDKSKSNPRFSNKDGSHCSSLGKYKLGAREYSEWGVHVKYVMHGLESTNSNAASRFIVFHSWDRVTDTEIYPEGTAEGWGCPTISNNSFKIIDPHIKSSSKPVLMWIYY